MSLTDGRHGIPLPAEHQPGLPVGLVAPLPAEAVERVEGRVPRTHARHALLRVPERVVLLQREHPAVQPVVIGHGRCVPALVEAEPTRALPISRARVPVRWRGRTVQQPGWPPRIRRDEAAV